MTEPQVWVLIGAFCAVIFGMLTWQTISFNRSLTMAIDAMRAEIGAAKTELSAELRTEIGATNAKIDALDRDVQALTRRVFGSDTP